MEDDNAPRLAPPPQPHLLQLRSPKPLVPELSLVADSETSQYGYMSGHVAHLQPGDTNTRLRQDEEPLLLPRHQDNIPHITSSHGNVMNNRHFLGPRTSVPLTGKMGQGFTQALLSTGQVSAAPPKLRPAVTQAEERHYSPHVYSPVQKPVSQKPVQYQPGQLSRRVSQGTTSLPPTSDKPGNNITTGSLEKAYRGDYQTFFSNIPPTVDEYVYPATTQPPQGQASKVIQEAGGTTQAPHTPEYLLHLSQDARQVNKARPNTYPRPSKPQAAVDKENINPASPVFPNAAPPNKHLFTQKRQLTPSASLPPYNAYHQRNMMGHSYNALTPEANNRGLEGEDPHVYQFTHQQPEQGNPKLFNLIEEQSNQISNLTSALEKILNAQEMGVLNKQGGNNGRPAEKEGCIDTQTQTTSQVETRSVGVNTDVSWADLLASLGSCEGQNSTSEGSSKAGLQLEAPCTGSQRSCESKDSWQGSEAQYRSAPLREAEEVHADPPGGFSVTRPSSRTQQEAREPTPAACTQGVKQAASHDLLPASYQTGGVAEEGPRHPPGATFYNNMVTNIQRILQSSNPAEQPAEGAGQHNMVDEGVEVIEEKQEDHQSAALQHQLLQCGVSFLSPPTTTTTPTTANHGGLVGSVCLPGVHNLVSLYQSSTLSTREQATDAAAAKYLTDAQLATIAALSPAVRKTRVVQQRRCVAVPAQPQPSPAPPATLNLDQLATLTLYDNFSIATTKFLERYGIGDD